jgi:hypothetical protein
MQKDAPTAFCSKAVIFDLFNWSICKNHMLGGSKVLCRLTFWVSDNIFLKQIFCGLVIIFYESIEKQRWMLSVKFVLVSFIFFGLFSIYSI